MNSIYILEVMAGVVMISGLFYALLRIRTNRLDKKVEQLLINNRVLQSDFTAMCSAAVNMGNRIEALDNHIRSLTSRQEKIELNEPGQRSYKQAKVLLENGVNLDDIVDNCGVTYGEAELLAILSRHEKQDPRH